MEILVNLLVVPVLSVFLLVISLILLIPEYNNELECDRLGACRGFQRWYAKESEAWFQSEEASKVAEAPGAERCQTCDICKRIFWGLLVVNFIEERGFTWLNGMIRLWIYGVIFFRFLRSLLFHIIISQACSVDRSQRKTTKALRVERSRLLRWCLRVESRPRVKARKGREKEQKKVGFKFARWFRIWYKMCAIDSWVSSFRFWFSELKLDATRATSCRLWSGFSWSSCDLLIKVWLFDVGSKRNHKTGMEISEREDMELENLPSFEDVEVPSTNDSKEKKPKLGSKARKLLKLQKQQGQKGAKYAPVISPFFPIFN